MKTKHFAFLLPAVLLSLSFLGVSAQTITTTSNSINTDSCVRLTNNGVFFGVGDSTTEGQVTILQSFLSEKGYLKVVPNGHFGPATLAAVKEFQGDNGITQNGVAGPATRGKIATLTCGEDELTITPIVETAPILEIEPLPPEESTSFETSSIGDLSVSLMYTGGDANGEEVVIPGGSSATGVNPLIPRTWSWTTTGAASVSASYVIKGENCSLSAGTKIEEGIWQPWIGTKNTGNRFLGSNTRVLDASYFGCVIEATYKARNTRNQTVSSTVKVEYTKKGVVVSTPLPQYSRVTNQNVVTSSKTLTGTSATSIPTITSFISDKMSVKDGETINLSWVAPGATSCSLSNYQSPTVMTFDDPSIKDGKKSVIVLKTHIQTESATASPLRGNAQYKLVCKKGSVSSNPAYVTVSVNGSATSTLASGTPVGTFTPLSPSPTIYPKNITYSLVSTNAKSCSVTDQDGYSYVTWSDNVTQKTIQRITSPKSYTYTTECASGLQGEGVRSEPTMSSFVVTCPPGMTWKGDACTN